MQADVADAGRFAIGASCKPKVMFVSLCDANDPNAESGYSYSMRLQLQRRFDIIDVFPMNVPADPLWIPVRAAYRASGLYYYPAREPLVLRLFARRIERAIALTKPQVVFATSSIPLSVVETSLPLIHVTDQVFCDFVDTYIDNPSLRFRRTGNAQEAVALAAATRVSYPSQWAAESAVRHYGQDPGKIFVIPWGGNLPREIGDDEVAAGVKSRRLDECHLVFLGRDWRRKGGDILVGTVAELNRLGLRTRATIIGCNPPGLSKEFFTVHPFLDKSDERQFAKFAASMLSATFMFLPSRAEAYGQVFCEAAAFGVPAIGSAVGGIPVRDGETGYLPAAETSPAHHAKVIIETLADPAKYFGMAEAARSDYRQRLNWNRFGEQVSDLISCFL
jgi:glycosyltransferase involved in cell wall biosynthesis